MKYIKKEKLDKIKLNKNNMYVVIDFDKTITSTDSTDSWDAAGKKLSEEFHGKLNNLYEKYRPIEINYKITFEEKNNAMEIWYNECMNMYYQYKLTKQKLIDGVKNSNLILRKGAKEFLKEMYENKVPVIILSAGIGNTIKIFLEENNCLYDNIYIISNFIKFDEKGNMKEFNNNIIHSLNKNLKNKLLNKFQETIGKREYSLLIGDSIDDKKMVSEEQIENTITVGVLNENIQNNLAEYRKNFDIVLTNEDANFQTIKEIVFDY